jgi:hypothetical protein
MPIGAFKLNSIGRYLAPLGRTAKTITAYGNAQVATAQTRFGDASARFDGTGDYLLASYDASTVRWSTNTDYTLEYWVRPNNMTNFETGTGTKLATTIGQSTPASSASYWNFGPLNNGSVRFFYYTGAEQFITTSGVTLTTGQWYHLAFVKNGTSLKIYVNGTQRASGTLTGTPQYSTGELSIGQYNNISINAWIDEVRISNVARYTANFTSPTNSFTNDANTLFLMHANGANASTTFTDDVSSTPAWVIGTATYASISKVITQEANLFAMSFSTDGTKMYLAGNTNNTIYQYTLSTAFNVSTASYASISKSVSAQASGPTSIFFKPDGTKMYVQFTTSRVYQYTLSTAWDVSSASYDSVSFLMSSQGTSIREIAFSSDGTKMYMLSDSVAKVFQYTLSTAWDLSTASYSTKNISVVVDYDKGGLNFNNNGTKMYIASQDDKFHVYTLSTAWDVSTATFFNNVLFGGDYTPLSVYFTPDGKKFFLANDGNATVYQFNTNA